MYNAPPPNLMAGIQLAQAGRKLDALPYLRRAARHETMSAEGWLWLAAATDDFEEYRFSVDQALVLDPRHPVASRMRDDLNRLSGWPPAPSGAVWDTGRHEATALFRPSRGRRALRALVLLLFALAVVGGVALLVIAADLPERVRGWLKIEESRSAAFTVGSEPGYRFRVEVPESWYAADTASADWQAARNRLQGAFDDVPPAVWALVETDFAGAGRDPVFGDLDPKIRLVETDTDRLAKNGLIPALTLHAIIPLPSPSDAPGADVCARMQLLNAGDQNPVPNSTVVEVSVVRRNTLGDCLFLIDRRYTGQSPDQVPFALSAARAPVAFREITLAVPFGEERNDYALWQITLADSAYADYERAIDRIVATLEYRGTVS